MFFLRRDVFTMSLNLKTLCESVVVKHSLHWQKDNIPSDLKVKLMNIDKEGTMFWKAYLQFEKEFVKCRRGGFTKKQKGGCEYKYYQHGIYVKIPFKYCPKLYDFFRYRCFEYKDICNYIGVYPTFTKEQKNIIMKRMQNLGISSRNITYEIALEGVRSSNLRIFNDKSFVFMIVKY